MKKELFLIFFLAILHTANSQVISSTEIIKSGVNDANKILNAYLKPLEKELCSASGSGFINEINTDNKPKFSINIIMIGSISPKKDRTYDVNNLNLENIKPSDENKTVAQTFS
ncbi:MAG: DUF6588 family protein, partial [Ignavibacterium sp.]|uniref:DUF6588 family protein n=1 Tax=Ignavibacterium sp. TaxID=2651167 RepID=UPI0040492EBF